MQQYAIKIQRNAKFRRIFTCFVFLASVNPWDIHAEVGTEKIPKHIELVLYGTRPAGEQAQDTSASHPESITLEKHLRFNPDGQFRDLNMSNYPGGIQFRYLTIGNQNASATVDILKWRNGNDIIRNEGKSASLVYANGLLLAPQYLLAHSEPIKPSEIQGKSTSNPASQMYSDPAGRQISVSFDTKTGDISSAKVDAIVYEYTDYRALQNFRQPRNIRILVNGALNTTWTAEAQLNTSIDKDAFEIPDGYSDPVPDVPLHVVEIATNTYRIEGGSSSYHTSFSVGTHSIAVFDAPSSVAEMIEVKALIEKTAPNKKVAFVIVSHTHNDHIAGLPVFIAPGFKNILTGKNATVSIQRQWGKNTARLVKEINAPTDIDLGGKILRLIPLDSAHASDMLLAYDADAQIIFQGDLYQVAETGPAPKAFAVNQELLAAIRIYQLHAKLLISVHGRVAHLVDLLKSLEQ